jgi:hypothetical protein
LMATIPSWSSPNAPRLLMMRGYAEFPTRFTLPPANLQPESASGANWNNAGMAYHGRPIPTTISSL